MDAQKLDVSCPTCEDESETLTLLNSDIGEKEFYCEKCCETFREHELTKYDRLDFYEEMAEQSLINIEQDNALEKIFLQKNKREEEIMASVDIIFEEIAQMA